MNLIANVPYMEKEGKSSELILKDLIFPQWINSLFFKQKIKKNQALNLSFCQSVKQLFNDKNKK